ncbi:sulfite transporter Ssu1 [Tothia fuscella]|uniref:Sulfite efflux pump SSU1 n=1 Tax=Tothia fuscella TaxID=1048955 RepID=A0A9P4NZC9_9PEZI|nr:sulfite transporter Ssu1 [Tothia fuscella]
MSETTCPNNGSNCEEHYHAEDAKYLTEEDSTPTGPISEDPKKNVLDTAGNNEQSHDTNDAQQSSGLAQSGFRRIIQNFTPSWFIITMSTGVTSLMLHQLPYHAHWLDIISYIFFVLNIVLFLLFTFISCLRYTMYPQLFPAVLRHPHQSLFLATFPIGLATLINMIVIVCVPAWGQGMAIFAWVLWWIVGVLATISCFHLTWVIMTNRRSDLAEMTALYFIPIVAIVIAATSGALVAGALTDGQHKLWTLIISYVFWGIGTPLSWIILTIYLLRLTVHKPLQREVIVSLLLPIGPLGLSGFSIIAIGKVARHALPMNAALSNAAHMGDIFYLMGLMTGLILWGFGLVWFIVAVIMIATAGSFPFNMGWWGFIFPVGIYTLLTITIGEEFELKFFKILACILTAMCVAMWFYLAARTIKRAASGKMFFAPCLGTDLFLKRGLASKKGPERV